MRFPYVSLVAFDAACARADAEHENAQFLRREVIDERAKYADLLDKYHALREKGYGHLEALPIAPQADFFGPRTRAALDAVGRGLPRDSRKAMEASARKLVEQEMTDDQIAALVRKGEPVRGVV